MEQSVKTILPLGLTQLIGHNSEETAYIQSDFPFGYRHKTERKYWIETTKQGQRLCTRLKHATKGTWFKVQKSTYDAITLLVLNVDNGHIETRGYPKYVAGDHKAIDTLVNTFELDENQLAKVKDIKVTIDIFNKVFDKKFKKDIADATSQNPLLVPVSDK